MAESRNLCAFEKNVLLALIAAVIQPNKVSKVYFHWTFFLLMAVVAPNYTRTFYIRMYMYSTYVHITPEHSTHICTCTVCTYVRKAVQLFAYFCYPSVSACTCCCSKYLLENCYSYIDTY